MLPSRYKQVQNKTQQNPYVGLGTVAHSCNPALRSQRQEDQELKVILSYTSSLRPVCDITWDTYLKNKQKQWKRGQVDKEEFQCVHFYQCKMFSIQRQMKSNLQQYIESSPYLIQKLKKISTHIPDVHRSQIFYYFLNVKVYRSWCTQVTVSF